MIFPANVLVSILTGDNSNDNHAGISCGDTISSPSKKSSPSSNDKNAARVRRAGVTRAVVVSCHLSISSTWQGEASHPVTGGASGHNTSPNIFVDTQLWFDRMKDFKCFALNWAVRHRMEENSKKFLLKSFADNLSPIWGQNQALPATSWWSFEQATSYPERRWQR